MKFWEAIKELEKGKKVKPSDDTSYLYMDKYGTILWQSGATYLTGVNRAMSKNWEIVEEPELYWQWRTKRNGSLLSSGDLFSVLEIKEWGIKARNYEKHAGPWVKTKEGFKKADNWEQF